MDKNMVLIDKTSIFIKKAKLVHGDNYDYSLVEYIHNRKKIKIKCLEHGIFEQTPHEHLSGNGCPKCGVIKGHNKQKKSKDAFISEAILKHENKYGYSLVNYINCEIKVKIICPEHGVFEQTPIKHLSGQKCKKCSYAKNGLSYRTKLNNLIKNFNVAHQYKFDYSLVKYSGTNTKVNIICQNHGIFEQSPKNHLSGHGCPICKESKGEKTISNYLKENNIIYTPQYKFNDCKHIKPLAFDFYLPTYNICIEFNDLQHYKRIPFFHETENDFKLQQKRDKIKIDYCAKNNIKLLVIKYNENIIDVLNKLTINYIYNE